MTITYYWKNEDNKLESVVIAEYTNNSHTKAIIERHNGDRVAVNTADIVVVTDIEKQPQLISTLTGFDIVNSFGDTIYSFDRDSFFDMLVSNTDVKAALERVLR